MGKGLLHNCIITFSMTNDNFLQVKQEYDKISKYCDPKADEIAVDTGGIRPIKPPSVPKFD